ncbi:MAG: class I SAM-dependent methyltransferase [Actinobacteria bacterium]|nr:MAG: class I SAM-dependent methyltransferase [Actinomycetota bacterium]
MTWMIDSLGIRPSSRVLDLAAGTGKFTRLLHGRVVAIEPIEGMRRQFVSAVPGVPVIAGVAEAIPLADESVDAITVAQAFHWFDTDRSLSEIWRVLRPEGRLGLVWNRRDESVPWVARLRDLLEPYEGLTPREWRRRWMRPEWTETGFTELEEGEFAYQQELDAEGLCGRVASVSFIAALEESERAQLLGQVRDLVAGFPEPFVLPYRTAVFWCSKRS